MSLTQIIAGEAFALYSRRHMAELLTRHERKLPRHTSQNKPRISQAEAARRLGVTRWHLNRVLNGHRESRSLTAKYHALQQQSVPTAAEPAHAGAQA